MEELLTTATGESNSSKHEVECSLCDMEIWDLQSRVPALW